MKTVKKSQPTSSSVHVPVAGEEQKLKKAKGYDQNDLIKASSAELITMPKDISGTNCENCQYSDVDFCGHPSMGISLIDGAENMCCDYWEAPGMKKIGVEMKKIRKLKDDTREVGKVAIIRGGKILIGTRADNGHYDFPGGRAKFGEEVPAAAIREVHEETGIELDPDGIEQIGHDSKEKNDKDKIVEVHVFLCDLDKAPPLSETSETDGEFSKLEWFDMSKGLPEEVVENMHTPLEENTVLQSIGVEKDDAGVQDEEPNGISDLQDAQELVSGIDYESEHATMDPLTARELALDHLAQDPMYYRKKRIEEDWTSDPLYKDTEEGEQNPFAGEGYNEEALQSGFWLDLGSHNCREPGHIGLDLYPYDHGTAVHDLDTGIPFPDASASKIRMANVLHDENVSDPKALLSEVHRVLMPGGQFVYEGPEDIYNYPDWAQDYPGLVMVDHEDDCDVDKAEDAESLFRQKFTRIPTPDPATANDAEPRIGIAQYDMLPADALLQMDATGYYWSDATSSGRGNRLTGYPSQGGLLNKGMGGMMGSASSSTESNHLTSAHRMFKGGPGSGRTEEGGANPQAAKAKEQHAQTERNLKDAREKYNRAPKEQKDKAKAELRQAMVDHQASQNAVHYHSKTPVHNAISKTVSILKAEQMKQVVYCVVLEPEVVDSQGDFMTAEDIESTAHRYMINARLIGSGHTSKIDAAPVESFLAPQDLQYEGQNGPQPVKKGSWVIGIKVFDPAEWQKVLNGEYTGVSVGGKGLRDEV